MIDEKSDKLIDGLIRSMSKDDVRIYLKNYYEKGIKRCTELAS